MESTVVRDNVSNIEMIVENKVSEIKPPEIVNGVPTRHQISMPTHYYQTFNNCGPATLSMVLNYYDIDTTQGELGMKLRPHQNAEGFNDDKNVSLDELANEARLYGFNAYFNPNGNVEIVKKLLSNDIPVITVTWLSNSEDIGHYRILTGYDENSKSYTQNDSYQGPNRNYTYAEFDEIWQPFNYKYLLIVEDNKVDLVESILGDEKDANVAWKNALERAVREEQEQPNNPYPVFNQSTSNYFLGNYAESVDLYERVESKVPGRMLWYQHQPLIAYKEIGKFDTVLAKATNIINSNNKAYSELYKLKGDVYKAQGNLDAAKIEYETAIFYNKNYSDAISALNSL